MSIALWPWQETSVIFANARRARAAEPMSAAAAGLDLLEMRTLTQGCMPVIPPEAMRAAPIIFDSVIPDRLVLVEPSNALGRGLAIHARLAALYAQESVAAPLDLPIKLPRLPRGLLTQKPNRLPDGLEAFEPRRRTVMSLACELSAFALTQRACDPTSVP